MYITNKNGKPDPNQAKKRGQIGYAEELQSNERVVEGNRIVQKHGGQKTIVQGMEKS